MENSRDPRHPARGQSKRDHPAGRGAPLIQSFTSRSFGLILLAATTVCSGQVLVRNHVTGAAVSSPFLLPDVGVNDAESVALDVVNTGSSAVTVESAAATGLYFSLCCTTGFVLPAGGSQTVTLTFAPTQTGYFTGALQIDTLAIFLFGRSIAAPSLFVQTAAGLVQAHIGIPLVLTEGTPFSGQFSCELQNNANMPVTVQSLTASGAFSLANAPGFPLMLAAGQQVAFTLLARASTSGALAGVVTIGEFAYAIDAHPPTPGIHINLPAGPLQSGQQIPLSISFDAPPSEALAGSVTLTLVTTGPVALTDPAILFTSTGTANAPFTSVAGQTTALFGNQSSLTLQTGTTAGSLHIQADWGYSQDEVEIPLAPSPIAIETIAATRGSTTLEINVTGYDNTRTAGMLSFAFFDSQGAYIGDPVTANFTQIFYNYFFQTEYNAGGMFKMTAIFPVTGGTGSISSVQVNLMNSAGNAQSSTTKLQ